MFIERPPLIFRAFFPHCVFRKKRKGEKCVYLTFDDGPIPEVTPKVLDILDRYGIKATFFMVGDNIRKHPAIFQEVVKRGHSIGNHTMHHLQGIKVPTSKYIADVEEAYGLSGSKLFRPPHGLLRWRQSWKLRKKYTLIMYDLVTRDYSWRITAREVFDNVKKFTRNGSIIVFHDSLKSADKIDTALPESIEWLISQGYSFRILNDIE